MSSTSPKAILSILLIENDDDDYVLMKDMLSGTHYSGSNIHLISSYYDALNIIRENHLNPYDICLIDYRLDQGNGLDLVNEITKHSFHTPIILLTGYGSYEIDLKAMEAGVDDYLDKSEITPRLLERSIRYAIERKHSHVKIIQHEEYFEQLVAERTKQLLEERDKLRKAEIEREGLIKSLYEALANIEAIQGIAAHSRDVVLFIRPNDGRILDANVAATTVYGYAREELLAMTIYDLRAPDTLKLTSEQMAEADRRGILFETAHRRKDGSTLPVEVNSRGAAIYGTRGLVSVIRDITERKQAEDARAKLIAELQDALVNVRTLRGLLPICSYCKKIRNDEGYWLQLEAYIHQHSEAHFSHGICPDCYKQAKADMEKELSSIKTDK